MGTKGRVSYGFIDEGQGIPLAGGGYATPAKLYAMQAAADREYGERVVAEHARRNGISLDASADALGPGTIHVPRYETEILDRVRRRAPLGQRINAVPATGQPSRFFEQRTIVRGGFTDPRQITQTPETPHRSERPITIKAISAQINFGLFDVETTRQQSVFNNLVAKDVDDMVEGVLTTSDEALWNGTDTDLGIPTTNEYVGGLNQINRTFLVDSSASIVDAIVDEVASIVSNRKFGAKPTAIYAQPQAQAKIEQEERLNHRQVTQIDVANSKGEVIAGVKVMGIVTAAGVLPIIPDWSLPSPTASASEGGKLDYTIVIVSEDLVERHYVTTPDPRVFILGLAGNLATQYVCVLFDAVVFKGKADPLNTPEAAFAAGPPPTGQVTYAHSVGTIVR